MNPLRAMGAWVLTAVLLSASASVLAKSEKKGKTVHGAIAVNRDAQAVGYAYDFKTAQEAKREALKQCGDKKCEVVVGFKNGCAAVAGVRNKLVATTGITRDEAETKVMRKCGT